MTTLGASGIEVNPTHRRAELNYDSMAERYLLQYWNMLDSHINLVHLADLKPDMTVLDVACGPGIVGYLACEKLGDHKNVFFVDSSKPMVKAAKAAVNAKYGPLGEDDKKRFLAANILDTEARDMLKKKCDRPQGFDVVLAHLFVNHFTANSKPKVLKALLSLCTPKGFVAFDFPLPSPSRHINGKDSDETHIGVRTLTLRYPSWADVSLAASLPVSSFVNVISEAEVSRAKSEAAALVLAANGNLVRSRDSHDRRTATADMAKEMWRRGLASKARETEGEPPIVKADFARREWFDEEQTNIAEMPRAIGMPYKFRFSYGLHVLVQKE